MFTSWCDLRVHIPGEWIVLADFEWVSKDAHIIVPRGFVTDLASTPSTLRALPLFDPTGASREAAVIHDWMYCAQRDAAGKAISRKQADDLFRRMLAEAGYNAVSRNMYWSGVRSGGWLHWNRRADDPLNPEDFVSEEFLERERLDCLP